MKKNTNIKKNLYNILSLISAIVLVTAICMLAGQKTEMIELDKTMEQFVDDTIIENEHDNYDILANKGKIKNPIDFLSLRSINSDIYAWIMIPGLDVSYPIFQSEEDNYYLWRNIYKYESRLGSLYTNSNNSKDFNDFNTIIYGHNVIDPSGNMFSSLHSLADQNMFDAIDKIIIYTPYEKRVYDLYSVVRFFNNSYLPFEYDFSSDNGRQRFIDMTYYDSKYDGGKIREGIEVTTDDKLITLSTCMLDSNYRLLVIGKLSTIYPLENNIKVVKVDRLTK